MVYVKGSVPGHKNVCVVIISVSFPNIYVHFQTIVEVTDARFKNTTSQVRDRRTMIYNVLSLYFGTYVLLNIND